MLIPTGPRDGIWRWVELDHPVLGLTATVDPKHTFGLFPNQTLIPNKLFD